jgi:hypothetical protein
VRFRPLPYEVIVDILEAMGVESSRAAVAAALCSGSIEQANTYLGEDLQQSIDAVFGLIRGAMAATPRDGLLAAQKLRGERSETLAVLDLLMLILNEILWLTNHADEDSSDRILVRRFAQPLVQSAAGLTTTRAVAYILAAAKAFDDVKYFSANPQLAVEGMLMAMRALEPAKGAEK